MYGVIEVAEYNSNIQSAGIPRDGGGIFKTCEKGGY